MTDTTHDIAGLIALMTRAIDAIRPGGVFSSNSKLSAALFALYEAMPALTALQAERDAWKDRAEAAEAALTRAYLRGRDDAAMVAVGCFDQLGAPEHIAATIAPPPRPPIRQRGWQMSDDLTPPHWDELPENVAPAAVFPPPYCTAWEDCNHDGICHDPKGCAAIGPNHEAFYGRVADE